MNNLNQAYKEVSTIGEYSKKYFSYLGKVLESIDENEINKLGDIFENSQTCVGCKLSETYVFRY